MHFPDVSHAPPTALCGADRPSQAHPAAGQCGPSICVPALVTGIYGMNVPIPYADSHYAFYIPILLSIGISIIISWYFMKKKWF